MQLRLPWTDTNGDRFVQREELALTTPATLIAGNWNRNAPDSPTTANMVDPNLPNVGAAVDAAGRTSITSRAFDHELARNVAVGEQLDENDHVGVRGIAPGRPFRRFSETLNPPDPTFWVTSSPQPGRSPRIKLIRAPAHWHGPCYSSAHYTV